MSELLLVDDDVELCELLVEFLSKEGFNVQCSHDGEEAVQKANQFSFDVIVLDVMLPSMNGFEVLKAIRERIDTPVLMLTARGDDVDRIVGLEIGADDYLPKPCNPRELSARLKAILRRSAQAPAPKATIELGNLTLDCAKRTACLDGETLELTNAEYNILENLTRNPQLALSKEELTEKALGRKYTAFDRSIDVHISNLRNKLGKNAQGNPRIKTVRGYGYMYDA